MLPFYQLIETDNGCVNSALMNTRRAESYKRSCRTGRAHDPLERLLEVDVSGGLGLGNLTNEWVPALHRVAE